MTTLTNSEIALQVAQIYLDLMDNNSTSARIGVNGYGEVTYEFLCTNTYCPTDDPKDDILDDEIWIDDTEQCCDSFYYYNEDDEIVYNSAESIAEDLI